MTHTYKQLVFTNHGWERLQDRRLTMDAVWQVVATPHQQESMGDGKTKYIRVVNGRLIHVVASWLPHEQRWLVISVWVRGEADRVPLIWTLITAPFRVLWWLLRLLFKLLLPTHQTKNSKWY